MALTPMSGGPAFAPKMPLRQQWLGRGGMGGINPRLDMEQMGAQDAEPLTYQGEPVDPRRMLSKPMPGGAPMSSLLDAYKQATGGGNTIGLPMMPPISGGGMQAKPMPGMGAGVSTMAPPPGGMTVGAPSSDEKMAEVLKAAQVGRQPPVSYPPAGSDPPVMEPGAQFTGSKQPPQVMPGQPVKPPVEMDNITPAMAAMIAKGDPGTAIKEAAGATDDLRMDPSKLMPTRYPPQMGVGVNHSMQYDPSKLQYDPSKPMPSPGRYGGPQAPPMGGDAIMTDMGPDHIGGSGKGRGRGGWGGGMGQPWPDIMGGGGNPAYLGGLRGLLGGIGGNAGGPLMTTGVWNPKDDPGGMQAKPMPLPIKGTGRGAIGGMPTMLGPGMQPPPKEVPMGKRRWTAAASTSARGTARTAGGR